jgi:hypothetical protein
VPQVLPAESLCSSGPLATGLARRRVLVLDTAFGRAETWLTDTLRGDLQ